MRKKLSATQTVLHTPATRSICQMAGDSLHVGIGSDFDGGFGLQSTPADINTVADLQNLVSLLYARGYSPDDAENILNRNWLTQLERDLPE